MNFDSYVYEKKKTTIVLEGIKTGSMKSLKSMMTLYNKTIEYRTNDHEGENIVSIVFLLFFIIIFSFFSL